MQFDLLEDGKCKAGFRDGVPGALHLKLVLVSTVMTAESVKLVHIIYVQANK